MKRSLLLVPVAVVTLGCVRARALQFDAPVLSCTAVASDNQINVHDLPNIRGRSCR